MAALGFELLFRFLWGSMLVLVFVSRRETSERFLRIAAYIAAGTGACAAWLLHNLRTSAKIPSGTPLALGNYQLGLEWGYAALATLLIGCQLYSFFSQRLARTVGFLLFFLSPLWLLYGVKPIYAINFLTGSLVLGSVFAGQYLGHWYLTVPGMHIRELKKVINLLFFALSIKLIEIFFSAKAWLQNDSQQLVDWLGRSMIDLSQTQALDNLNLAHSDFGLRGSLWMGFGTFGILLLISRILWGIVAPVILGYMIKKTVDIRATQSATGILYALSVAVIFGEGAAIYLRIALGICL